MMYSLADLIDRFSILRLKIRLLPQDDKIQEEYDLFLSAINSFSDPRADDWIKDMTAINERIWHLESDIRQGKEKKLGLLEVGRRALAIRDINKERIEYKNTITRLVGGFEEKKVDHASA